MIVDLTQDDLRMLERGASAAYGRGFDWVADGLLEIRSRGHNGSGTRSMSRNHPPGVLFVTQNITGSNGDDKLPHAEVCEWLPETEGCPT